MEEETARPVHRSSLPPPLTSLGLDLDPSGSSRSQEGQGLEGRRHNSSQFPGLSAGLRAGSQAAVSHRTTVSSWI